MGKSLICFFYDRAEVLSGAEVSMAASLSLVRRGGSLFYTTVIIVVPAVKHLASSLRRTRVLNICGQL